MREGSYLPGVVVLSLLIFIDSWIPTGKIYAQVITSLGSFNNSVHVELPIDHSRDI